MYNEDEKINWLRLGTALMSAFFLVVDIICAIQIGGIFFKFAFTLVYIGQINALIYIIKDCSKEANGYYKMFIVFYGLACLMFAIEYINFNILNSLVSLISGVLLALLIFKKDIKERKTNIIAIIICLLQVINAVLLKVYGFEAYSVYNYGLEFLSVGVHASPIFMSLVQIQMIRSKYIDKKSRGTE